MQLPDEREEAAADWLAARRVRGGAIADMPPDLKPQTLDAGYRVQEALVERLRAAGGPQVGWKVGVTTPQMRAHLGLDHPIGGMLLFGGRVVPGATLRHADYARVGIECEIAMVLGAPLGAAGTTVDVAAANAAVATVHPAIELVDDRYGGSGYRSFGVPTIVGDNSFHAAYVLGPPCEAWRSIDLAAVRGVTRAGGTVRCEGRGADVQGHPMASLAWIANHLASRGRRLEPGDLVITGSLPVPYWAQPGDAIEIEIEHLGALSLTFA